MNSEIRKAVHLIEHVINDAQGPIFTAADYGRVLRSFLAVCTAMENKDQHFKEQAEEAARVEAAERKKRESAEFQRLLDELGDL